MIHRLRFAILGVLAVLLLACPRLGNAVVLGIDVSHWQGTINWNSVKNAGREFAFIKATEGVGYTDPRFYGNISGATNAGVLSGAYHFATPYTGGVNDAVSEANWFVQQAGSYIGDGYLPPVLDLETQASLGQTTLSNWARTFVDRVETLTGTRPILYTSANYASNYVVGSIVDTDLWIAHWGTSNPNTGTWRTYLFHQYTDSESVAGVSGGVDGNRFPGSLGELFALTNPVVIPEPAGALLVCASSLFALAGRRVHR